jgi:hypothetical protein
MPLKFWKSTVRERVRDLEMLMSSAEARIFALEEEDRPKLTLQPSRKPRKTATTPRCVASNRDGTPCRGPRRQGGELCHSHWKHGATVANGIAPSLVL